jgi:hypothetical protein
MFSETDGVKKITCHDIMNKPCMIEAIGHIIFFSPFSAKFSVIERQKNQNEKKKYIKPVEGFSSSCERAS